MAKMTREQAGVKAGDKIILKGKVTFARLDKAVTGDALVRENERRAKLGMLPTKEFRSITIEDPEVVKGEGTALANFYGQTIYKAKGTNKPTISIDSKSLYPPQFGHIVNGVIQEIPDPQRNPATGQIVYIMISAFAPKGFANLGSSFDAIVFEEGPINFYEGNNSLTGFGAAMNMPVEVLTAGAELADPNQQPVSVEFSQPVQQQAVGFGQPAQTGFGQPTQNGFNQPAQTGFGQPAQNGFGQAPVGDPNQPVQTGFGQPTNPFGVQDSDIAGMGGTASTFGTDNTGRPSTNPFA